MNAIKKFIGESPDDKLQADGKRLLIAAETLLKWLDVNGMSKTKRVDQTTHRGGNRRIFPYGGDEYSQVT